MVSSFAYGRISVMYAHDKLSDMVAQQCLSEMYPKNKRIEIQESDEPCIIFCVLKKFGIMSATGVIDLENYRKRVKIAHQLDQRNGISDYGGTCIENAEATQHKQDVCKKAKVFNDCTHLYRILLK
uniref:Odorant binding protein n=1 Tax=Heliothis virescens TaxID=7102 RepID=A0A2A4IV42_HELVI